MATKRKASWISRNVQENVGFQAHRKLDLRTMEEYKTFRATKYVFGIKDSQSFSVTAHENTPAVVKEDMIMEIDRLILDSMQAVKDLGCPLNAIIHFYLHCDGLEHDFIWNGVGKNLKTLRHMLNRDFISDITDRFMMMIQSGREVTLNNHTKLSVMAFNPPPELIEQVDALANSTENNPYL